jgi:signal transduction histidine kinase
VLFCSALDEPYNIVKGFEAGGVDYIINSLEGLRRDYADLKRVLEYCTADGQAAASRSAGELRSLLAEIEYPEVQREMEELLDGIYSGALKVHEVIKSLRAFSTSAEEPRQTIDIRNELERAILMVGHKFDERIAIERHVESSAAVTAQPGRLSQVFLQLLENSLEAIEQEGEREQHRISVSVQTDPHGEGRVLLQVTDDGCGMSEETLRYAREPFYTVKEVGRGTGLGLTTVEHIIGDLGGEFDIESSPGKGTTVFIRLPLAASTVT